MIYKVAIFTIYDSYQDANLEFTLKALGTYFNRLLIVSAYTALPQDTYDGQILHLQESGCRISESDKKKCQLLLFADDGCFGPVYAPERFYEEIERIEKGYCVTGGGHMIFIKNSHGDMADAFGIVEEYMRHSDRDKLLDRLEHRGYVEYDKNVKSPDMHHPPFLGWDNLVRWNLDDSSGEKPGNLLNFILEHTTYDSRSLWKHLLRTNNVYDLKRALHLEYILPWKYSRKEDKQPIGGKVAVIVHLHYEEQLEENLSFLSELPEWIDLIITTSKEHMADASRHYLQRLGRTGCRVIIKENRGRDVSALLVACRDRLLDYDYLCFVHDKKSERYLKQSEGDSFRYGMWDNLLKSREYIYNVLNCFEEHKSLGFLTPPEPYYGSLLGYFGESWGRCFEGTKNFIEKLGISCELSEDKLPITISTSFWCRTEALKPLLGYPFRYEDFPEEPMESDGTFSHVIEHIFAYVAQHQGYYTAIVMNEDYASLRGNGLEGLLIASLQELRREMEILRPSDIPNSRNHVEQLISFCRQFSYIYIYGAGTYGRRILRVLGYHGIQAEGFIVSDGKRRSQWQDGIPIYEFSELFYCPEQVGILVALNAGNKAEILRKLEQSPYSNRFDVIDWL